MTLDKEELGNLTFLYMLLAKNLWQYEECGSLSNLRRELLCLAVATSNLIANKNPKFDNHDMSRFRFRSMMLLMKNTTPIINQSPRQSNYTSETSKRLNDRSEQS